MFSGTNDPERPEGSTSSTFARLPLESVLFALVEQSLNKIRQATALMAFFPMEHTLSSDALSLHEAKGVALFWR